MLDAVLTILTLLGLLFAIVLYGGIGVKCGERFEDTENPVNLDIVLMLWMALWPVMLPAVWMVSLVRKILRLR